MFAQVFAESRLGPNSKGYSPEVVQVRVVFQRLAMVDLPLNWESGAAMRAPHIGIPLEKLLAARDLVRGAMGTEWFEREERRLARPSANIAHAHPLFRQLTSPSDPALVDVAELAFYLTALRDDGSIGEIIKDLRGGKFWATLFELAMAYRWQDAGAQVRLAPVTAKGKADFYATIGNTDLIVEVSRFEDDDLAGQTSACRSP